MPLHAEQDANGRLLMFLLRFCIPNHTAKGITVVESAAVLRTAFIGRMRIPSSVSQVPPHNSPVSPVPPRNTPNLEVSPFFCGFFTSMGRQELEMQAFGKFEGILAAYWIEMTVHAESHSFCAHPNPARVAGLATAQLYGGSRQVRFSVNPSLSKLA